LIEVNTPSRIAGLIFGLFSAFFVWSDFLSFFLKNVVVVAVVVVVIIVVAVVAVVAVVVVVVVVVGDVMK